MKSKKLSQSVVRKIQKKYPELRLFFSTSSQYFQFCNNDRRFNNVYIDYIDGLFWVVNYNVGYVEKSNTGFQTFDEAITYFYLKYL